MNMHYRLRTRREELGIKMKTICEKLNIPMSTYQAWEIDSFPRKPEQYKKLADYLRISFEYLMFGTGYSAEKEEILVAMDRYIASKIKKQISEALKDNSV